MENFSLLAQGFSTALTFTNLLAALVGAIVAAKWRGVCVAGTQARKYACADSPSLAPDARPERREGGRRGGAGARVCSAGVG